LKIIAKIISWIIQPLLMPVMGFAALMFGYKIFMNNISILHKLQFLAFIASFTFVIPVIALLFLKAGNFISNIETPNKKERQLPMLIVAITYLVFTYLLQSKLNLDKLFTEVMLSMSVLVLFLTIITYFWKISIHAASISGIVGLSFSFSVTIYSQVMFYILIGSLFVAGLVMTARLYLNAHNILQIIAGSLLGLVCGAAPVMYEVWF